MRAAVARDERTVFMMNSNERSSFSRLSLFTASRRRRALRVVPALLLGAALTWAWRSAAPSLTRGPYLQDTSATGTTLVFRTSSSATSVVRYGTHPGPPWEGELSGASQTTHVFQLAGLRPETTYHYEIASGGSVLAGGKNLTFRTSPPEKSRAPFRFLAWGDSGTGSSTQFDVAKRMEEVEPFPDLALGLGDLVYDSGEWENYDPKLFEPYAGIFPRMTFWPTLGNHDVKTSNGAPYLDAFYLPTDTGAPGHPSNTERYYSFDHGMAHFVCADSESSSSDPGSAMHDWLADDLDDARARGKRWLFVFLHHPPYSKGTHDSDDEGDLIAVRENLVPLFESKGVDMVMVGHSHNYERSYLARNDAILQNDQNDYTKIGSPNGTIYMVSGCGGKTGSGSLDHPLMATSYGNVAGFSIIDVGYDEVRGSFVERDGETTDLFTIHKAADRVPPRVVLARSPDTTSIDLVFDEPLRAGTGPNGAENAARYQIYGASVLDATLASDLHTVTLRTTSMAPGRGYQVYVLGVADETGNVDLVDQRAYAVAGGPPPPGSGGGGSAGVPQGANWRYLKGLSAPPGNWNTTAFSDSSWAQGQAGFGFGDGDDATVLGDMLDNYVTVYVRRAFTVSDPSAATGMELGVDYDDGFVAYLNGTEIARANVPAGQTHTTVASPSHEAGVFESFDVNAFQGLLVAGTNVLAVEGHNGALSSSDFSLHPELTVMLSGGGGGGSGPPVAVFDSDVQAANAPAWVNFSSARSLDPDGGPLRAIWDFGDGSRLRVGPSVQHRYDADGLYTVTLIVRDRQFFDSVDRRTIRVHSVGNAPQVRLNASSTQVNAGARVDFDSRASVDPDGGPLYAYWNFDDPGSGVANTSTLASTSHVFATAGTYTVSLAVMDDEGSTSAQSVVITVR